MMLFLPSLKSSARQFHWTILSSSLMRGGGEMSLSLYTSSIILKVSLISPFNHLFQTYSKCYSFTLSGRCCIPSIILIVQFCTCSSSTISFLWCGKQNHLLDFKGGHTQGHHRSITASAVLFLMTPAWNLPSSPLPRTRLAFHCATHHDLRISFLNHH